ncbi:MAG: FAD-binding oxidoreductase [Isosphaeraceae bacterium]
MPGEPPPNWPENPPDGHHIADGRHAHAVIRPQDTGSLREAIARGGAEGFAFYPRGGGTAMHVGEPPGRPGWLVDTTALDRVIEYPAADMTITVEAGTTLAALQETLAGQGQHLPLEAPEPSRATLGGIFATNTCGPRRFGYGRPRDQIIGVGFINGSGELVKGGGRVVKNVAGYDLPKLLTGSFGTLGVICQFTLKVRPRPADSALVLVTADRIGLIADWLETLNTSASRPVAIDVLNRPAAAAIPGAGDSAWTLAIGLEDAKAAIDWQVDRLRTELQGAPISVLRGREAEPAWAALVAFQATAPGPVKLRGALKPSLLTALLGGLDGETWAVQAHAGSGVIHAQTRAEQPLEELAPRVDNLRAACARAGGYLVVTACPSDFKSRLKVWGDPRSDWALGEAIKKALDPHNRMNPGRFVATI